MLPRPVSRYPFAEDIAVREEIPLECVHLSPRSPSNLVEVVGHCAKLDVGLILGVLKSGRGKGIIVESPYLVCKIRTVQSHEESKTTIHFEKQNNNSIVHELLFS